jgi:hypothetical protein
VGAWSRGAAPANQPLSFKASPNREFNIHASVHGKAPRPRHGQRPHRASAHHITRSLFNYLVPRLQDKRTEEEIEEGGTGPDYIG